MNVNEFLSRMGLSTGDVYGEGFWAGHGRFGEQFFDWSNPARSLPGGVLMRVGVGPDVAEIDMTVQDMLELFASLGLCVIGNSDEPFMSEGEFLALFEMPPAVGGDPYHLDGDAYYMKNGVQHFDWTPMTTQQMRAVELPPDVFRSMLVDANRRADDDYVITDLTATQFLLLCASLAVWVFKNVDVR